MKLSSDLNQTMARFHQLLDVQTNFDIVYHTLTIGGKQALIYFVDGLTKDEVLLRIMQGFASIQPDDMPDSPHGFSKKYVPYGETGLEDEERSWSAFSPAFPAFSSTAMTNASPSTAAPTRPAAWRSRKKTRCSGAPGTALWRP